MDAFTNLIMGFQIALSPYNLMIATDGTCKVSDFGLAKGYGAFDEVTTAGVRVDTP